MQNEKCIGVSKVQHAPESPTPLAGEDFSQARNLNKMEREWGYWPKELLSTHLAADLQYAPETFCLAAGLLISQYFQVHLAKKKLAFH